MNDMLDANVFSCALSFRPGADSPAPKDDRERNMLAMQKASFRLLSSLKVVRIPAVVLAEVARKFPKQEIDAALKSLKDPGDIRIEPFTGEMADLVARTLVKEKQQGEVCPRCSNPLDASPCPVCHRLRSHGRRVNDAYIVATAALARIHVERLYSFDPGLAQLGKAMGFDGVRKPEAADGDIFDPEANPALAAVSRGAAPKAPAAVAEPPVAVASKV